MHSQERARTSGTETTTAKPKAADESASASGLKASLRGKTYDEGAATLAPVQAKQRSGSGEAVQREAAESAQTEAAPEEPAQEEAETGRDYDADVALIQAKFADYADIAAARWGWSASQIKSMIGVESQGKEQAGLKGNWTEVEDEATKAKSWKWVEPAYKGLMQPNATAWAAVKTEHGDEYLRGNTAAEGAGDALISSYDFGQTQVTTAPDKATKATRTHVDSLCYNAYVNIMFGAAYMNIAAGEAKRNAAKLGVTADATDPALAMVAYNYGGGGITALMKLAKEAGEKDPSNPTVFTKDAYLEADVKTRWPKKDATWQAKKVAEVQDYVVQAGVYEKLFKEADAAKAATDGGTGTKTTDDKGATDTGGAGTTTKGASDVGGTKTTGDATGGTSAVTGGGEVGTAYRLQVAYKSKEPEVMLAALQTKYPGVNFYYLADGAAYRFYVGAAEGYPVRADAEAFKSSLSEPESKGFMGTYVNGVKQ